MQSLGSPVNNTTFTNEGAVHDELPPTYDAAVASAPPVEPPPSYQSIFGELQRTKKESTGFVSFMKNLAVFFFSTIGFLICLSFLLAIPISCIVIGTEYRDYCPIEPKIPLYLIVLGSFGVLRNILCVVDSGKKRLREDEEGNQENQKSQTTCEGMIDCFLFAWFICGNVWVYHNYKPDLTDSGSPNYCHQTLYLFAFWLNTATYIFFGACCCCFCCVGCLVAMFSDEE